MTTPLTDGCKNNRMVKGFTTQLTVSVSVLQDVKGITDFVGNATVVVS